MAFSHPTKNQIPPKNKWPSLIQPKKTKSLQKEKAMAHIHTYIIMVSIDSLSLTFGPTIYSCFNFGTLLWANFHLLATHLKRLGLGF
jgi:hypothetical protein